MPAAQRRKGYERALAEAGLPLNDAFLVVSTDDEEHGYTEKAGYEAMRTLLRRGDPPGAVFAVSDIQALGALRALKEASLRVPEEVAIVGFDDIKVSEYVGLSTLRQPMREMGKAAVEKMLLRMKHPDHPISHTVFSPSLVARRTSSAVSDKEQPLA